MENQLITLKGVYKDGIDIGIAMCHWALVAQEAGLHGEGAKVDPGIALADAYTEYTIRWIPA